MYEINFYHFNLNKHLQIATVGLHDPQTGTNKSGIKTNMQLYFQRSYK